MGSRTSQDYLLDLMKTMTTTSEVYAEVIRSYGKVLQSVDKQSMDRHQDLKSCSSHLKFSMDELNRITHQISRCLTACEHGDVDEMSRLRDELIKDKSNFH